MDWNQFYILLLSMGGLFLSNVSLLMWFRAESRSDWRHMDNQVKAIQEEIKDFHARLCIIEERRLGK